MREKTTDKQGLRDLVDALSADNLIVIEVGSYSGESAEIFLDTGKVANIICIDPWETIIEKDGRNTYMNMTSIEHMFDRRMAPYAGRFSKFKGTYEQYVTNNMPYAVHPDVVYIDAIHTYEACKSDIKTTIEFLKPKLAIAGHDYADQPQHIIGVKRAVNEIFGKPDRIFCDTSWLKFIDS